MHSTVGRLPERKTHQAGRLYYIIQSQKQKTNRQGQGQSGQAIELFQITPHLSNFRMKLSSLCSPLVRYMQDLFRVKGQRSRSRISSGRTHNNGRISFIFFSVQRFLSTSVRLLCSFVILFTEMKPARLVIAGSLATRDGKESKILGSCSVRSRFFIGGIRCFRGGHLLQINCNCKYQLID